MLLHSLMKRSDGAADVCLVAGGALQLVYDQPFVAQAPVVDWAVVEIACRELVFLSQKTSQRLGLVCNSQTNSLSAEYSLYFSVRLV